MRVWEDSKTSGTTRTSIWEVPPFSAATAMEGVEGDSKKEKRKKRKGGQAADEKKRFKPY